MFINIILTILSIITIIPIPIFMIYGVIIAFKVNIIAGFIVLLIEPAPLIVGIMNGIWKINIIEIIVKTLSN